MHVESGTARPVLGSRPQTFVLFHTEEIKTLKQQVVSLRTHLKSRADEVEQYKVCKVNYRRT